MIKLDTSIKQIPGENQLCLEQQLRLKLQHVYELWAAAACVSMLAKNWFEIDVLRHKT